MPRLTKADPQTETPQIDPQIAAEDGEMSAPRKARRRPALRRARLYRNSIFAKLGFKYSLLLLMGLIVLIGYGAYQLPYGRAVIGGYMQISHNWLSNKLITTQEDLGLSLTNLELEGRNFTPIDMIMAEIDLAPQMALGAVDIDDLQARLGRIGWLQKVRVERRWPQQIYIQVTERLPAAIWQIDRTLYLIDSNGIVIDEKQPGRFDDLPQIIGQGAPDHLRELTAILEIFPFVQPQLKAANFVGGRRWSLILNDGLKIHLPAEEPLAAMHRFASLRAKNDFALDKWLEIDLRLKDRIIAMPKNKDSKAVEL